MFATHHNLWCTSSPAVKISNQNPFKPVIQSLPSFAVNLSPGGTHQNSSAELLHVIIVPATVGKCARVVQNHPANNLVPLHMCSYLRALELFTFLRFPCHIKIWIYISKQVVCLKMHNEKAVKTYWCVRILF